MDKFSKWTGLAHSILAKSHPKLKRSQARECLATWLGHRTYVSLRVRDLDRLHGAVKYAIIDAQAAIDRANRLGFPVTSEQWREVEMALRPSGISGDLWLTDMRSMHSAARLAFEDQQHPDLDFIWKPIGMPDGRWTKSSVCQSTEDNHPDDLRFTVHGEVRAFNEHDALAVSVHNFKLCIGSVKSRSRQAAFRLSSSTPVRSRSWHSATCPLKSVTTLKT